MFTLQQITLIQDALLMAAKSNLRAMNAKSQPEFKAIYSKIDQDINEVQIIMRNAYNEQVKNENKRK